MTRTMRLGFSVCVLMLLSTYPLAAQTAAPSASPKAGVPAAATHKSPCWQQAGISQSAIQQRKQIEESTHSQVESVCSDSSLTPQQKQQKIHELREETQKQIGGLITPQQEQALKSCRASRGEASHMGGMHSGGGPCAEMATGNNRSSGGKAVTTLRVRTDFMSVVDSGTRAPRFARDHGSPWRNGIDIFQERC